MSGCRFLMCASSTEPACCASQHCVQSHPSNTQHCDSIVQMPQSTRAVNVLALWVQQHKVVTHLVNHVLRPHTAPIAWGSSPSLMSNRCGCEPVGGDLVGTTQQPPRKNRQLSSMQHDQAWQQTVLKWTQFKTRQSRVYGVQRLTAIESKLADQLTRCSAVYSVSSTGVP